MDHEDDHRASSPPTEQAEPPSGRKASAKKSNPRLLKFKSTANSQQRSNNDENDENNNNNENDQTTNDKRGFEEDEAERTVIWGTTVNASETMQKFKDFLMQFPDPQSPDEILYIKYLAQIHDNRIYNININAKYLHQFDARLYKLIVRYPSEVIPLFDIVIHNVYLELFPDDPLSMSRIQVRVFNLLDVRPMRALDPADIDQLVAIRGMVTRASTIIPDLREAFFMCQVCEANQAVGVQRGQIPEPPACRNCHTRGSMIIVHNRCVFADKQLIKLQETPDSIPEGETPHTVSLLAFDDLVDVGKPGDRVEITGIYRANPIRSSSIQRTVKTIFKNYIDILHLKKTDKGRFGAEDSKSSTESEFYTSFEEGDLDQASAVQEENLLELSRRPNLYALLTRSLAPSIWELDDVKKGILCQLFGGTNKQFNNHGSGRVRGEINILLCGDPGTSKSQLLSYVHKLAPRGIYTSGRGSSAVGLTAYVTKDPDSRESVLESGALVLSDRGVCCIDEFDKMTDHTRSILHEAMEQQTVSVAKAGIICTLNARTSILASANPLESRYNPRLSVVENLQLPPPLLSRFDLIYLVLDKADESADRRLAKHIVSLYWRDREVSDDVLPLQTVTAYISYARRNINPVLTDPAAGDLVQGYLAMRKGGGNRRTITATPRQLESLIRISEAHARMRFSSLVERIDVAEAIRLVKVALQQAAMDPRTGTIDMDLITTGRSAAARSRLNLLAREVKNYIMSMKTNDIRFDQLHKSMQAQSSEEISSTDLKDALQLLVEEEVLSMGTGSNPNIIRVG